MNTTMTPAQAAIPASTLALGMAALMAATRFHDVGSALHLVDASLAVFFLGGLHLRRSWLFGLFFAEAVLIDIVATTLAGTSDYCMTAAYPFLLPTYATMWLAGSAFARRSGVAWRNLGGLAALLVASTLVAYVISSGSFYLFSDYFAATAWQDYLASAIRYLPSYLTGTFTYVAVAVLAQLAAQSGFRRAGA